MKKTLIFDYIPYNLEVLIREGEDGFFVASCPRLKGCHSQGHTVREALGNIEDAILGYIFSDAEGTIEPGYELEETTNLSATAHIGSGISTAGETAPNITRVQYSKDYSHAAAL